MLHLHQSMIIRALLFVLAPLLTDQVQIAAEESNESSEGPLNANGQLIDVQRDIVPILKDKCLSCHGPDDAKNDFRVDDHDAMMDYIEEGDAQSSSLYTDYLTTDDPEIAARAIILSGSYMLYERHGAAPAPAAARAWSATRRWTA